MPTWVRPTLRVIDWRALALVVPLVAASAWLLSRSDRAAPGLMLPFAIAAMAASAALALNDPGRSLVRAVPTPPGRRLVRRLAFIGPGLVVVAFLSTAVIDHLFGDGVKRSTVLAEVAALFGAALAVHAVLSRRVDQRASEICAAVPLVWIMLEQWFGGLGGLGWLSWWREYPLPIALVAVVVTIVATRGRAA